MFLPPPSASSIPDASETVSGKIRIATSAEATAGTNDLTAMTPAKTKSVVDAAVVGGVTYQGTFDASAPADLSNATKGDLYIISVAGTYQGQTWAVGDHLLINADMGGTLDPAKIDKVDNTDSVTSVAGRTGAVTLSTADISGLAIVASTGAYSDLTGAPTLATVATTGAYSDLSGTPSLATVATTGAYSDLSGTPTLGTAAAEDVGTLAGNVVQLDGSARLPAVDGSQLTNLPAAPVTSVAGKTGAVTLVAGDISGLATVATTGAYSDLTGTPTLATVATTGAYSDLSGTPSLATVATTGAYSDLTGTPTLGTAAAEDVGTLAGNVVQLDGTAKLPAVDGSQLTNLPSAPVTSVAGKTGAVTLVAGDISGLATVATTGAYSDLTGTPTLATVATTGAYSDLTGTPTLGTAAALDVGTSANNVVQLNGSAQLPAVDGSLLTGVTASASPPSVTVSSPATDQTLTSPSGIEEVYIYTPSANITVNLVAAATCGSGFKYNIKNRASGFTVTVDPNGTETIDGATTFDLDTQESSLTLVTDGSSWFII